MPEFTNLTALAMFGLIMSISTTLQMLNVIIGKHQSQNYIILGIWTTAALWGLTAYLAGWL